MHGPAHYSSCAEVGRRSWPQWSCLISRLLQPAPRSSQISPWSISYWRRLFVIARRSRHSRPEKTELNVQLREICSSPLFWFHESGLMLLRNSAPTVRLPLVKKGLVALLAVLLLTATYGGSVCGSAIAATSIEAPCCGKNCPRTSALRDSACCHVRHAGSVVEALPEKSDRTTHHVSIAPCAAFLTLPKPAGENFCLRLLPRSRSEAVSLALLCSRQI